MPWSHCRLDPALQTIGGRVSSAERCHVARLMADYLSCQSMGIWKKQNDIRETIGRDRLNSVHSVLVLCVGFGIGANTTQ